MKVKFDMRNANRNFALAVDAIGKLTGLDRRKIVMAEAGSVLKRAFGETRRPPSQAALTIAGRLRALKSKDLTGSGPVSITAGKNGAAYGRVFVRKKDGAGYRRTHDANFSPLNQHYTDAQWAEIREAINLAKVTVGKVVPEVKASAGIARQSWILIADSIGIRLEAVPGGTASASAIASAREARAKGNKNSRNGRAVVAEDTMKFVVTLINSLPYGQKLGFQGILDRAIAGRAKYMQTALAHGFAASAADVARLFPGWKVSVGSN